MERSLEQLFRLSLGRRELARQAELVGATVSRGGYGILRILVECAPLSMGDLARVGRLDPAVAARQVNALEGAGLVERVPSPDDGRLRLVDLTADGRDAFERIVRLRVGYLDSVLADWPAEDLATLVDLVDRLVDDLGSRPYDGEERA